VRVHLGWHPPSIIDRRRHILDPCRQLLDKRRSA
jgi:hypothetical protein